MSIAASTRLYNADQSRRIDAIAIETIPISGYDLMQRAARFAFECIVERFPNLSRISVWCGKGNNAGDAYLVAALAAEFGMNVQLVSVPGATTPPTLSGAAALAHAAAESGGLTVVPAAQAMQSPHPEGEVIVDGLLGTGISGEMRPAYRQAIEYLNAAPQPVVSLDLPSGVNADTGGIHDVAVRAALTVSFITRKIGLYTGPGVSLCGQRLFNTLGVPDSCYSGDGVIALEYEAASEAVDDNAHKHQRGGVLVVGGDEGMPGAVILASSAALRAGAGLVTTVAHPAHHNAIVAARPEVMVATPSATADRLASADLVVLGPGLGRNDWGARKFAEVEASTCPVVLDADGLWWLAERGEWRGGDLYLTPHAGEAGRLLGTGSASVNQDRLTACQTIAEKLGHCVKGIVLKGAGSVVYTGGELAVCMHGNPGMATAGMGDVLSGIAGGLLVSHYARADTPPGASVLGDAFRRAVALHSAAGDLAAARLGQRSVIASDVIDDLAPLLRGSRV